MAGQPHADTIARDLDQRVAQAAEEGVLTGIAPFVCDRVAGPVNRREMYRHWAQILALVKCVHGNEGHRREESECCQRDPPHRNHGTVIDV